MTKNEVLISGIKGATNIPFANFGKAIGSVPKDKPIYVFCRTGDWSEQAVEVLTDRGYDAYNVEGGYQAYRQFLSNDQPIFVDAKGLKCPGPIVKVADTIKELKEGQKINVEATEDAFCSDIAVWCERTGNKLNSLETQDGIIKATITKSKPEQNTTTVSEQNDKTFVVFSGDLDKTIASFIIANGAAALGRKVTMFFTFWGLNILRKPKKVKVKKTFIEKNVRQNDAEGHKKVGAVPHEYGWYRRKNDTLDYEKQGRVIP